MSTRPLPPRPRTCPVCGEPFVATSTRRSCGDACAHKLGAHDRERMQSGHRTPVHRAQAGGRTVRTARGLEVLVPSELVAAGVAVVDCRGATWEPL